MENLFLNDVYTFKYREDFIYQGRFCGLIELDGENHFIFDVINQYKRDREISKIIFEISRKFIPNKMFFNEKLCSNFFKEQLRIRKSPKEEGEYVISTTNRFSKSIVVPADDLPDKFLEKMIRG